MCDIIDNCDSNITPRMHTVRGRNEWLICILNFNQKPMAR